VRAGGRGSETTVDRIEDAAGLRRLRTEWDGLLADSDADCVFLTWEWLAAWWRHLAPGRWLHVLAVRRGRDLLAIAPLVLRRRGLARLLTLPSLEFLGAGSVGSDYLDVILRRGHEETALAALAGTLEQGDCVLDLGWCHRKASAVRALAGHLSERGWEPIEARTEICPFIRLARKTWETYLESLGTRHRYNYRRRLRHLETRFDVRFERAGTEEERRMAFGTLLDLHERRWSARGGSTAFDRQGLVAFHEDFTRQALERGWLRLFVLRLDGRPAAALYGLRYKRVFYFYQSGFDPGLDRESVGMVTMGLAIRSALEEGAAEYDMLHGAERYKFLWARETREISHLEIYPPQPRAAIHRGATELGRGARRLARRLLPRALSAAPDAEVDLER
jgi:CelD/BcsL family acetyltransferase involved in cellulose biosynthesis